MFNRYLIIGASKKSLIFYDKKLKRAITFVPREFKSVQKNRKWTMYKYMGKIYKYGVNKFIIKMSYVAVPILLLLSTTFFRATYTMFHLYLFLFLFIFFSLIIPIVVHKTLFRSVKYYVPRTAKLTDVNDAFMSLPICKTNVYEKITFKIWIGKIIGPMCVIWVTGLFAFYNFWDGVIHNQIVNAPINKLNLINNLAPGLLFGLAMLVTFVGNLVGRAILLKKHQRGEIETLPDDNIEN